MKKLGKCVGCFVFAVLVPAVLLLPQDLITDRPDFTESASTVPLSRWQFEFGYTFEKDDFSKSHNLGELLVRFSFIKNLEFRLGLNSFRFVKIKCCSVKAFEDIYMGLKWAIIPDYVALLAGTTLPTGGREIRSRKLQPEVTLALAKDITGWMSVGANFGYARLHENEMFIDEYSASLAAGFSLTGELGTFIEYFGFFNSGPIQEDRHFFDFGFTYLLSPDVQLDVRVGRILNSGESTFFIGAGAVIRK